MSRGNRDAGREKCQRRSVSETHKLSPSSLLRHSPYGLIRLSSAPDTVSKSSDDSPSFWVYVAIRSFSNRTKDHRLIDFARPLIIAACCRTGARVLKLANRLRPQLNVRRTYCIGLSVLTLTHIDLTAEPDARTYVKSEIVGVVFAMQSGEITSAEGPNRFTAGDALITGSTGDRWSVSRDRFDAKYIPVPPLMHGQDGSYKNKAVPILAKQIHEPFSVQRSTGGDVIHGKSGDWLMQYGPGDYGIVAGAKFAKVYRLA